MLVGPESASPGREPGTPRSGSCRARSGTRGAVRADCGGRLSEASNARSVGRGDETGRHRCARQSCAYGASLAHTSRITRRLANRMARSGHRIRRESACQTSSTSTVSCDVTSEHRDDAGWSCTRVGALGGALGAHLAKGPPRILGSVTAPFRPVSKMGRVE